MKYFVLAAMILACSSCANRSMTLSYYPSQTDAEALSRAAEKECQKYGMVAELQGRSFFTAYGRDEQSYWCRKPDEGGSESQPFGSWTWPKFAL